jgi:hypothetical protein
MDQEPAEDVAFNRCASVVRTPRGYEVRRPGRATVETYPPADEGFDDAWDRFTALTRAGRSGRVLSALVIVGVVAALLWFVVSLVAAIAYVAAIHSSSDDPLSDLISWISPFTTVFYALFVGAVGSYAVVWLYGRGIPRAPSRR